MISEVEQRVLEQVDDAQLIAWIRNLTRIPSVWRPQSGEGEEKAARWVAERCREIGLTTHLEFVRPGRPNVIAYHGNQSGPTLMFEGHTDVVTEGDPEAWTDPPFDATVREGRIYGRGANDMKAGLVCALFAIKVLIESGIRLNGNLLLGAVCDEEGEMIGIKHFVEQGWADRVSAAIICEPEENHLCLAQKGVMWIRVAIHGEMCHGAMPLTGVNSAYPLAHFLLMVRALEEREIALRGNHPFLGQPSITPTIVRSPAAGEAQNNVMPGSSETVLDFRLIPEQNPESLVRQIEAMLVAITAVDERLGYDLEVLEIRHPTKTDPNHPLVVTLASAYRDLCEAEPTYGGVPGSTDGTVLHAQKGIPIVTCGPGDIHVPHQVDEWVSIEEIKVAVRLYILAAMRFLGHASESPHGVI